ncbi:MAG TPA: sigma-70 family RNA polymerase sigma factor [Pirellulales bacterium]|nr:sigma-70 family RNA polymerase sigma factor [Pirellulales bacterium]
MTHANPPAADAELVAHALAGDREAFAGLYDRYARLVRAVVRPAAADEMSVHDLAQDCFLRAYRKLGQLRQPERFGSWLAAIARQVGSENRRRLRRDRHQFVDEQSLVASPNTDVSLAVQREEEAERLLDELTQLPESERLAVHAFFLEERDIGQTAELLDLSRSGAYAVLARGCRRLTRRLRDKSAEQSSLRNNGVRP